MAGPSHTHQPCSLTLLCSLASWDSGQLPSAAVPWGWQLVVIVHVQKGRQKPRRIPAWPLTHPGAAWGH